MEIDKIFNGGVDSIADNIFGTVNNSVSEVREMQKKKVAENVQLVIQALKKIESDLREQFGNVSGSLEKRILSIKDGKDGINGRDGKPGINGKDGKDGRDGRPGRDGLPGRPGADGQDGVGVLGARIDFDGALVITLTNGQEINVGEVVAPELAESIKVITNGGGTSQGVLDTLASLQAQISAIASLGAVSYQGTWNASTNTPTITSGSGTKGYYYVVSVAGTTSIDSEAKWGVGDWIVFNGTSWQKVDGGDTGDFTNLNVSGTTTLSGGTANGVAYLNGSKVLTSGSALTFDGTNFGVGGSGTSRIHAINNTDAFSIVGLFENTSTGTSAQSAIRAKAGTNTATLGMNGSGVSGAVAYFGSDQATPLLFYTGNSYQYWQINGSEQMRLTSTGLGIGTSSPNCKFEVKGGSAISTLANSYTNAGMLHQYSSSILLAIGSDGTNPVLQAVNATNDTAKDITLQPLGGNLGLGVTPSTWSSSLKALQINSVAALSASVGTVDLSNNYAYNGTNNVYLTTGNATIYSQYSGQHVWKTAPSGTAGNAITFTQAMTLDASGNLALGDTSTSYKLDIAKLSATSTEVAVRNSNGRMVLTQQASGGSVTQYYKDAAATYVAGVGSTVPGGSAQSALIFSDYQGSWVERARIDSSGNLLVGTTSGSTNTVYRADNSNPILLARNGSASGTIFGVTVNYSGQAPNDATSFFLQCNDTGAERMTVRSNGGIANYQANDVNLSDRREKTNFAPAKSYLDTICSIPVQTFNYIDQAEDDPGTTLGVVAQDVQAVAPELVMESNWGTKEEPKMRLSIYQTDLQYALMKCIQEQQALIQQLTARVAQLEGK